MIFHIYIGLPQCLILPDGCANWSTCHHELFDQPQTNHHFMVFWWEDHCRESRGFKVCDFCTHPRLAIPGCQFASWRSPTGGLRRAKRLRRFVLEFMVRLPRKQYPRINHGYCGGDIPERNGHCEEWKIMVPNRGFSSKPCLIMFEGMFEGTGSAQWLGLLVGRIRKTK